MNSGSLCLAIDVGNSGVKLGLFSPTELNLPTDLNIATDLHASSMVPPNSTLRLDRSKLDWEQLRAWLPAHLSHAFVTTVCRSVSDELVAWWHSNYAQVPLTELKNADLPLPIRVQNPDRVGTDRIVASFAAARRKDPSRAAVVVDVGSAVTVDLVSSGGEFMGGAILPGIRLLAQSLNRGTSQLPFLEWIPGGVACQSLPAVGKSTSEAIQSGVAWGLVGAVRELITRISYDVDAEPDLFFTGGDGAWLARQLSVHAVVDPHLVLQGIAWAAHLWMQRGRAT